jgi:hypothetical protein
MNGDELYRKMIAAARLNPPGDQVPYAFEKRIMARLARTRVVDGLALWGRALSRAAICCLAVAMVVGAWTVVTPRHTAPTDLSQDFENALLAAVDQPDEQ